MSQIGERKVKADSLFAFERIIKIEISELFWE